MLLECNIQKDLNFGLFVGKTKKEKACLALTIFIIVNGTIMGQLICTFPSHRLLRWIMEWVWVYIWKALSGAKDSEK